MRATGLRYCGECFEDFIHGQTVWYTWIENACFCSKCKEKLHVNNWELRKVVL